MGTQFQQEYYSFELSDVFAELCIRNELKEAVSLVHDCFDRFRKEPDSITRIILEGLEVSTKDPRNKLFYKYLLKCLEMLYLEFERSQA
jgi:hypothetical protein